MNAKILYKIPWNFLILDALAQNVGKVRRAPQVSLKKLKS